MNKILLVGFVCISLGAFAQSSADQGQTPNAKTPNTTAATPQDAASGQTSGKRMHKPLTIKPDAAAADQATGKGGKTANDDWTTPAAAKTNSSNNGQPSTRVATGDVNGDGRADLTATKSSGSASNSSAPSPRDAASGQASGKRQHQPVTVRKEVDAASPKSK
jgi:hypothetical protein